MTPLNCRRVVSTVGELRCIARLGVPIVNGQNQREGAGHGEVFGIDGRFEGLIDEVTIYNRAHSGAEIQGIFNAGSAGKSKDPVVLLANLALAVIDLNLINGIPNALDAKLDAAFNALDDTIAANDVAAINALEAFINSVEAQRGNKISEADGDTVDFDATSVDTSTIEFGDTRDGIARVIRDRAAQPLGGAVARGSPGNELVIAAVFVGHGALGRGRRGKRGALLGVGAEGEPWG